MRFTLRMLGLEILTVEASTEDEDDDTQRDLSGGDTSSSPIGFTRSPGDQRWERGTELS